MSYLWNKLLVAIISSVAFSLVLFLRSYVANESFPPFIIMIYAAPVFILGGIPASILIDGLNKFALDRLPLPNLVYGLINVFLYGLTGSLVMAAFWYWFLNLPQTRSADELQGAMLFGIAPAVTFYLVSLLVRKKC